jgi:hypothetical protein
VTLLQGLPRFANEETAGLGDSYLSGVSLEEPDTYGRFDLTHSLGQRRLGDIATSGSPGEVALFGHRHHQPHPSQLNLRLHPNNVSENGGRDLCQFVQTYSLIDIGPGRTNVRG